MVLELTEDVKQEVIDRIMYKVKQAKVGYFTAEAMDNVGLMESYRKEYETAMSWLISHNLA